MTIDIRALCSELIENLEIHCEIDVYSLKLIDRARLALAEPEPPADGEVAELVAWFRDRADSSSLAFTARRITRAADLLERLAPQPELEGPIDGPAVQSREPASVMEEPSDEAIESWAAASSVPGEFLDPDSGRWERCLSSEEFCATVRAVLARWGHAPNA
jgi:hypothetical protein